MRADDGGADAGLGEGEPKGDANRLFDTLIEERILKFLQALPVGSSVGSFRRLGVPGNIGNWALGNDAHAGGLGSGKGEVDGLLVRDIDRRLQSVESAAVNRVSGIVTIAAVADKARLSRVLGPDQHVDNVALAKHFFAARVELEKVDKVGLKALKAAVDAFTEHLHVPIGLVEPRTVTALGEQMKLIASATYRAADLFLAIGIAFGGVNDVESRIKRGMQQVLHVQEWGTEKSDLGSSEAKHADIHAGFAEGSQFHLARLPRNTGGVNGVCLDMAQAAILQSHEVEKLREIVKDIRIAMLTTVRGQGAMSARPMAVTGAEFDGDIYFLTKLHSRKLHEIGQDDRVSVSLSDARHDRFLVLSGRGETITDKIIIRGLWNPAFKAWFPDGLEDPEIAAIKVSVEEAEYWEGPGKLAEFFGIAKAVVTGQEFDGGDHAKISIDKNASLR